MSLDDWASNGWLRPHRTSRQEVSDLLGIVERDLKDAARTGLSNDWRFGIAYNAALKLCTVLLYAEGFRPASGGLQHYRPLAALPLILGEDRKADAEYLDTCRRKRNTAEYDRAGAATGRDAEELLRFARALRRDVLAWLHHRHGELMA